MPQYIHIDKDELYDLYITKNLMQDEVAKILNVKPGLIRVKLKKYGIKKSKEAHQANIERSCLEKYGVTNAGGIPESIEKIKKHNIEKYGVTWYMNSDDFKEKTQNTLHELYGENISNVFQTDEIKEKIKQTNLERYGVEYNMQCKEIYEKVNKTFLEKYGVKHYTQTKEYSEKARKTCLERYGVEYASQYPETIKKMVDTKRRNHTFNTSKPEKEIYMLLCEKFSDVKRQYKSELYPFACDFYIPELDLYIEYQGFWSHGKQPFDENDPECIKRLEKLKSRNTLFFHNAIDVWTVRDPLKRKTAKENNLNWLEFFNMRDFMNWYNNL